jgi:hypothetical protein
VIKPWDKTALAIAVEAADEDMARALLDAGADRGGALMRAARWRWLTR